jgi:hypothetical protein
VVTCGELWKADGRSVPGRERLAADSVDVAHGSSELGGDGDPQVGVDGPGTICARHRLRGEAGASRHLTMDGCGGRQEIVRELVRLGEGDAGTNRGLT